MADTAAHRHPSPRDDAVARARSAQTRRHALRPLTHVDPRQWYDLGERAIEPNGYYLPGWELSVNASARDRTNAMALCAFAGAPPSRLIGLMPVVSLWRAWTIPLPALVSAHPYGTLCSPLLDRDAAVEAAAGLLMQAKSAGAHALVLRDVALDGPAMNAIAEAMRHHGLEPRVLSSHARASLDATQQADQLLRGALGGKKLKELRRQRQRLAEHGIVSVDVARTSDQVTAALETFLQLEASGWKGKRGTALIQHDGDAAFIRCAAPALAESGQCEIISLRAGETPIAAGVVLRHQDRAFFFKLGIDERFAKYSPGVQLTLELTRHLCTDPTIASADSTASADHPMINPIWRGRLAIGDALIPLRRNDPVVALIHAALVARVVLRECASRLVRQRRTSAAKAYVTSV